ncbi:MAG: HAMP domain-containing protein [Deltaproteobacteria bacterium]|nr:HAMP domain-containing protein [Deltaproteobacteria bacterium]
MRFGLGMRFALSLAALAAVFGLLTFLAVDGAVRSAAVPAGAAEVVRKAVALFVGVNTLLLVLFSLIIFNRAIARPLRGLADRADRAATDAVVLDLGGAARDEVGDLSLSLNRMAARLRDDRDRMAGQLRELEAKTAALEQARDQLVRAEKLALVGRLSAGIAHEIGSPLGAILGYVDMLRHEIRDNGSTANIEFLDRMEKEINRINRIVRELLDYSRPASFRLEDIDLRKSVEDVTDLLMPQKAFRAVEIATDLGERPVTVYSDWDRLRQVLMNLLFNASDSMGGKGRIDVTVERTAGDGPAGEFVALKIKDTGCGIARDEIDRIFEPFYTTKVPGAGTGLGLAVSQRLVERMGGRIEVESTPGSGSTFSVILRTGQGGDVPRGSR